LLDVALPKMEREGRIEAVIGIEILRARAFRALDDSARSFSALERALMLAEPSGYIRTFVDEGEPLRRLIAGFRSQMEKRSRQPSARLYEYTDRILAAFTQPAATASSPSAIQNRKSEVPGLLSAREMSVLRLLPSELSTAEMADELVISVNTLRTHLKNVYDKLGAHSRYEAIARAKELGLL
jgi:LuxR family maltose regulon positive regulatory protein